MSDQRLRKIAAALRVPQPELSRRFDRRPLGQILLDDGDLAPSDQMRALALQSRADARFGTILIAHGLAHGAHIYAAIARQFGTTVADFQNRPPDARLVDAMGVENCLSTGILPWLRRKGQVLVASARPEQFEEARPDLEQLFGPVQMVITSEIDLHDAVLGQPRRDLADKAETRVPADYSCRAWPSRRLPWLAFGMAMILILSLAVAPGLAFIFLAGWAVATLVATTFLKVAATLTTLMGDRARRTGETRRMPVIARLPTVSILVPLYKEREIASHLIKRMQRLTYPRELLDICLVVEADDQVTIDVLTAMDLPQHIRQIKVPHSTLRTKPRALNYALDFCRGTIIGVYDAEDAPSPDQIQKVVHRFHERGPETACLQGVLDFYNARRNWFSRCFTIEYATWFRVMLPGLAKLGLVVPLGGTTLFVRRGALQEIGGWDAHNVTEDADLGVRLARCGYRTELIETITEEEANCRLWPWIKQRSRWLKGYAITWAVHTRQPRRLWSDLGGWRFFGVQLLFLGTISQFMLAPVLWSFWVIPFGLQHPAQTYLSATTLIFLVLTFLLSELANIAIGIYAIRKAGHGFLTLWVPTMLFYFPVAALAAYKGVVELMTRPFYWDKTAHGVDFGDDDDAAYCAEVTVSGPVFRRTKFSSRKR